jgi:NAD(P)-dependent dehydrogenase (short-subunit alcohol dehydrogenase family)
MAASKSRRWRSECAGYTPQRRKGGPSMDKVVLVTGASAGIGQATAAKLAGAGWTVVAASRRGTAGEGWTGLVMDVDDDGSVAVGVRSVIDRFGHIDALVTCAGWGLAGAVENTPIADAKAQLETLFWGTARTVQAVLPAMRANRSGRIVLLSSIGGVIGLPFQAFYSASKFAIEGWGEALAYEVAPFGIKVTLVQPGNFRTSFTENRRTLTGPPKVAGTGQDGGDAYAAAASKAVGIMERDEQNGASPESVAKVVRKVLESSRPPRRASVGKASERAGLIAKRALPFGVFQAVARGSLGV